MPKLLNKTPVMRNSAGRARAIIHGRAFYLGSYGSVEAQEKFDELLRVYLSNGRQIPSDWFPAAKKQPIASPPKPPTIAELVDQYLKWADGYYIKKSGKKTGESGNLRDATRVLKEVCGYLTLPELGPNKLRQVRDQMIKTGIARRTVNYRVQKIRRFVKWCVSREFCDQSVLVALQCVESLAPNRGGVETSGTRGAVPWSVIEATLPFLPYMIRDFILVLWWTGARVSEMAELTTGQIDRSGEVWIANLAGEHKTACREKGRLIYFGPAAQAAITPWLLADPDAVIFAPNRVDERQATRTGKRLPGKTYGRSSLAQCLRRAIKRAGVESWCLAQIRHSAAVRITDEYGLEAARVILGHSKVVMTRHYAQSADREARRLALKFG